MKISEFAGAGAEKPGDPMQFLDKVIQILDKAEKLDNKLGLGKPAGQAPATRPLPGRPSPPPPQYSQPVVAPTPVSIDREALARAVSSVFAQVKGDPRANLATVAQFIQQFETDEKLKFQLIDAILSYYQPGAGGAHEQKGDVGPANPDPKGEKKNLP